MSRSTNALKASIIKLQTFIVAVLTHIRDVSSLTYLLCLNTVKPTAYTVELKINVLFYTSYPKIDKVWMFSSLFLPLAARVRRLNPEMH
jgi:hypothetical protein